MSPAAEVVEERYEPPYSFTQLLEKYVAVANAYGNCKQGGPAIVGMIVRAFICPIFVLVTSDVLQAGAKEGTVTVKSVDTNQPGAFYTGTIIWSEIRDLSVRRLILPIVYISSGYMCA